MKKYLLNLLLVIGFTTIHAQEKKKDTIKTEIVNVVTSYVPKITDAFKIKQKPVVTHSKETERKKLDYQIISVPVASTFIPKSGSMKKINLGKQEFLYPNYLSLGFGNSIAPFAEVHIRQSEYFNSEYGGSLKFLLSSNPVNTALSSTYLNAKINAFYQQKERYYTWKASIYGERNQYNWYGLPSNIAFNEVTLDAIEPQQAYNYYGVEGAITFDESYFKTAKANVNFMTDGSASNEFDATVKTTLQFPLEQIHRQLNDIYFDVDLNFLAGTFATGYDADPLATTTALKHSFLTAGLHPYYSFFAHNFTVQLGAKTYFALNSQASTNKFYIYPNVEVSYPIVPKIANVFIGATGDLENNSYQKLSRENPYVSPTLNIAQSNTQYNAFVGVKGIVNSKLHYTLKGSYAAIENNPFYVLNPSKSNGTNNAGTNAFTFFNYEYGNSFNVMYDNIKRTTVYAEASYKFNKQISFGTNLEFNSFSLHSLEEAWNTPNFTAEVFGTYNQEKWYGGGNIFLVGSRKGILHDIANPNATTSITLNSYVDVNFNGGYHFSDSFSVFLNLKNIFSSNYQQYTNFNVQGFQAMAGLTWKFDGID